MKMTFAKNEPAWGSVDKTKLPDAAFADPKNRRLPYAWVDNGALTVHKGGLAAAFAAVNGAHTGDKIEGEAGQKIRDLHKRLIEDKQPDSKSTARCAARQAFSLARTDQSAAGERWYHTMPEIGEYPTPIHLACGAVPGILVIDADCYARMQACFDFQAQDDNWPGVLVDKEHTSEQPGGDSSAMAWAKAMKIMADGLWTQWDWTSVGEPLATGHVYAFRSPATDLMAMDDTAKKQLAAAKAKKSLASMGALATTPGRWRPVALSSIALTNKPHFDLAPALGREQSQPGDTDMDPEKILAAVRKALGLADDGDVVAAVTKLVSDNAAAQTTCTKAKEDLDAAQAIAKKATDDLAAVQAKQLDAEAEAFVLAHKARIKDVDKVRAQFKTNPECTRALFGSLVDVPAASGARTLSREDTQTPADRDATAHATDSRQAEIAKIVSSIGKERGVKATEAFAIAEREHPELFTTGASAHG